MGDHVPDGPGEYVETLHPNPLSSTARLPVELDSAAGHTEHQSPCTRPCDARLSCRGAAVAQSAHGQAAMSAPCTGHEELAVNAVTDGLAST